MRPEGRWPGRADLACFGACGASAPRLAAHLAISADVARPELTANVSPSAVDDQY